MKFTMKSPFHQIFATRPELLQAYQKIGLNPNWTMESPRWRIWVKEHVEEILAMRYKKLEEEEL